MTAFFTARRFNQDTARAKRAAEDGPVYVTVRGRLSHVLLSFEDSSRLVGGSDGRRDVLSALGSDAEATVVELDIRHTCELPRAVDV